MQRRKTMIRKYILKKIAAIMTAMLMLTPYTAFCETAEESCFGKTEASVEKKTVPMCMTSGRTAEWKAK